MRFLLCLLVGVVASGCNHVCEDNCDRIDACLKVEAGTSCDGSRHFGNCSENFVCFEHCTQQAPCEEISEAIRTGATNAWSRCVDACGTG